MSGSGRWAAALARAGIDGDPRSWAGAGAGGAALLAGLGAVVAGPSGAVVLATVTVVAGVAGLRLARDRGVRRADGTLPELLEHAARSARAGFDLAPALERAAAAVGGPHGEELRAVVARMAGGAPLAAALGPWRRTQPRPMVHQVTSALEVALAAGGSRARALDGVAATVRSQVALDAEVRALAGQAQASAAVLVALPLVFAVVGSAADPRLAGTLFGHPVGLACVATALALDLAGAWWMRRIVGGAVPAGSRGAGRGDPTRTAWGP